MSRKKRYSKARLIFDFAMVVITGGVWLVWLGVKYLRLRRVL